MSHFREIAFIDPAVADFEKLVGGLRPDVEPVLLSPNEPAMAQMARILEYRTNLDAIHVIAHGRPGEVNFASGAVSCQTMDDKSARLSGFCAALGTDSALLIWACESGAGERGAAFVDALAARTGVRIAAASGIVGAESRGGTWSLDRGAGPSRAPLTPEGMRTYTGIMATFTGTTGNDTANATTGTLTGFSGGTVAQLQDAIGDTFNGGNGADAIVAGSGDDTINLGSGQFVAGESIQGGANSASGIRDQLVLTASGTFNFSLGVVSGIETLTGSSGSDTVTMTASQWAGFVTLDLGSGLLTTDVLNVLASGNISALTIPTVSSVEVGNLIGTTGTDTVTLSGAQLNAILIGTGTINLGDGNGDTINLTSTSSDLNSLGTTNASIQGVEAISASGAAAGVTITLSGQTEAFALTGSNQADTITGGSGADTIVGGAGADTLNGGAGNDIITYDGLDISIAGGTNTDTLTVNGAATINLSSVDQSSGDAANVTGFENVNASGSSVAVSLTGDGNANVLTGGSAADTLVGGTGADTLSGGAGNDTITYDGSDVSLAGAADIDTLLVNGAATINLSSADQSSGDTAVVSGFENVNASGSSVAVSLTGDGNANVLTGGSGADTIVGGAGADTLNGGAGNDTITYDGADISIAGGTNTDTLTVNGAATINLSSVDQSSGDAANVTGFENVNASGSSVAVSLTGDGNANVLTGGSAADTLAGGAGADTLNGGAGNDTITYDGSDVSLAGAADIDTLLVNGAATINLSSADQSSGDTAVVSGFENVNASGSSVAVSLTGDGNANVLTGGSGADTLNGGAGNDTITYNGSAVLIAGGADIDTLLVSGAATINLSSADQSFGDTAVVTGFENVNASGSSIAVSLLGDGNANVLTGGLAADTLVGGAGADTLSGGAGNNIITYDGSDVSIAGGADIDTLLVNGAATINLSLADQSSGDAANTSGFENVNASGSIAAVSLTGNNSVNVLTGGSANDTLNGGGGNDAIDGGGGTGDTAVFSGAFTNYTITLSGAIYTVADNRGGSPDGTDTVTGVENFQFSDGTRTASQLTLPPTTQNKIVLENLKQGNPVSEWGIDGDGDGNIQGFATEISTNIGQTVSFKIATDSANYRIEIYRLGYYGGDGARKVATVDVNLASAQVQPHPIVDMSRGLIDAGNWAVSASWAIPQDMVSGVYIAKLVREDGTAGQSHIPFIVRDDNAASDIVFQTSDTTWQAYNAWGGASLYYGEVPVDPNDMIGYMPPNCSCGLTSIGRATAVSYNRPIITNTSPIGGTHDFIFGVEHSAIRWLEQNGYDVSYISGVDATRSGSLLLNHEAYLSVGHDEYWSAEQRTNVEAARDAGVNLAFWSGNEVYWKVRWETSIDGNGTPYRTMVTYKETWGGTPDPSSTATGTWRDPRFADPGQEPENSLTGTMFSVDGYRLDTITIPYDYSNLRFWRNTDVSELQPGQTYSLVQNLLGYEWDSDVENGYRPAGLINMSLSTVSVDTYLRDYGTSVGSATVNHSLTMYRAESGALVFGAGTVFWSWGLDSNHEGAATPTDPNVQQAMVNMFADMGIQPGTLDASLILATQSTDTIKPTSTITSPTLGASFVEGQKVTVTGSAQDLGGGIVAGVEVSLDGGQSWWKATGREAWSYSWVVQASGTYNIMSRAVDDSLNLGNPSASTQVTVNLPSTSSLWTLASKPQVETNLDREGIELGVRFQAETDGVVNAIRFYKGFYNVGQHVVSLWTTTGTRLATGTSSVEPITGWQTVTFANPVRLTPGTSYVASYHTGGYWSSSNNYFASSYTNGMLTAQGGVYAYSSDSNGVFPSNNFTSNYWVDVVFAPDPNLAPTAANDSGFSVGKNGTLPISFAALVANDSDPNNDSLTVSAVSNATNGTVTLDTQTGNVIYTPNVDYSGPGSFSYTASDGRGGTATATVSMTVQQNPAGVSLFQRVEGPTGPAISDTQSLELGMKFTASTAGTISGISFYKPASATGVHTGSLWSSTGTLLATVTFTNESTSGWQTATFSNPIAITAGTTYVASYHTAGVYAATANYFATSKANGALTAPSSAASAGNGLYVSSSGTAFPTASFQATNYWVDVVYNRSTVNIVPIAGNDNGFTVSNNNSISIAASLLLANDSDSDGDPLTITTVGGATNGMVAYNSQTSTVTFTPTSGYIGPASFSYGISDGRGGTASGVVSLTVGQSATTLNLFSSTNAPSTASANDPDSVELGVKFAASSAGLITGLRYYKSSLDTGTHTGSLWTGGGNLLASATFTNESATGWQTVTFTQPVSISAGATYVASYHSNGFYGSTPNFFATGYTNGPLSAPSSAGSGGNGVFAYGTASLFPTATYNATNYWVDVLYEQSTGNLSPVALGDSGFSTPFNTALSLQASTLLANDSDSNGDPLAITSAGNAVNGTVAFDSQSNAVTFTPTSGYSGPASFTYSISDGQGGSATGNVSLTIVPQGEQTLFSSADTPANVTVNDPGDVNLGMKFQADVAGAITGIRFYKGASNTGSHTGYLWTATGTLLGSATFTNESTSGWQSTSLVQQVDIQANTTYVVSYSTDGFYSATGNFFGSEVSNNNLHALSSALSGGNGVYAYGASGLFPTSSFNNTNYYVDVAFKPQLAA
jgi:Ca2+-binding RTX toxin-like protein